MIPTQSIKTSLFLLFFCSFASLSIAQKARYAVQVGAFEQAVELSYFKGLQGVYETVCVNQLYRYYIDVENLEAAQALAAQAQAKGFQYSRVVDFKEMKEQCDLACGYTPPQRTKKTAPSKPSSLKEQGSTKRKQGPLSARPPQAEPKPLAKNTPAQKQNKPSPRGSSENKGAETRTAKNSKTSRAPQRPERQNAPPANAKKEQKQEGKLPSDIHSNPKYSDFKGSFD